VDIPDRIGTVRVRKLGDGSFFISRKNSEVEQYLDKHFTRVRGECRWVPTQIKEKTINDLVPLFAGKKVFIIGKGPSLDLVIEGIFGPDDSPIICINESIHHIEVLRIRNPIFAIQQDTGLKDTCKPKFGELFCSHMSKNFYANFPRKYIFHPTEYVGSNSELTVNVAIEIAKFLGAVQFVMVAFDGCTTGNTDYSTIVPYKPTKGGSPNRFLDHRRRIETHLKGIKTSWLTPKVPELTSSDTLQPLQHSPQAHHDAQTEHQMP